MEWWLWHHNISKRCYYGRIICSAVSGDLQRYNGCICEPPRSVAVQLARQWEWADDQIFCKAALVPLHAMCYIYNSIPYIIWTVHIVDFACDFGFTERGRSVGRSFGIMSMNCCWSRALKICTANIQHVQTCLISFYSSQCLCVGINGSVIACNVFLFSPRKTTISGGYKSKKAL